MRWLIIIAILAIGCTEKTEVATESCTCNEVKDKEVLVYETPYLYWKYRLYVDYCGTLRWIEVQQSEYNSTYLGDCK